MKLVLTLSQENLNSLLELFMIPNHKAPGYGVGMAEVTSSASQGEKTELEGYVYTERSGLLEADCCFHWV